MIRKISIIYLLSILAVASGCSVGTSVGARPNQLESLDSLVAARGILAEGSLSITREAPASLPSSPSNSIAADSLTDAPIVAVPAVPMIGLVPGSIPALLAPRIEPIGAWLSIDQSKKTLSIVESGTTVFSAPFFGNAPSGSSYSVLLKQRNAVWFAPDQYFTARGLDLPATSSRERYLKGALGDFVVYLAENFAIYSGPTDVPEISGIRVEPNDLARLYYLLPVGAKALSN